jgi:hypothetical protein
VKVVIARPSSSDFERLQDELNDESRDAHVPAFCGCPSEREVHCCEAAGRRVSTGRGRKSATKDVITLFRPDNVGIMMHTVTCAETVGSVRKLKRGKLLGPSTLSSATFAPTSGAAYITSYFYDLCLQSVT